MSIVSCKSCRELTREHGNDLGGSAGNFGVCDGFAVVSGGSGDHAGCLGVGRVGGRGVVGGTARGGTSSGFLGHGGLLCESRLQGSWMIHFE